MQKVAAGRGQSPRHACVPRLPAPAPFTLPDPAPSVPRGCLRSRAERRREVGAVPTLLSFLTHGVII